MAETLWPPDTPDTLEDICIQFLVKNLHIIATDTGKGAEPEDSSMDGNQNCNSSAKPQPAGNLELHPAVFLPKAICDRLLEMLVEEESPMTDKVFALFSNSQATQLSRVDLRHSAVTHKGAKILENQPVVELAMKYHCEFLPVVRSLHKTLRSLRFEKDYAGTMPDQNYPYRQIPSSRVPFFPNMPRPEGEAGDLWPVRFVTGTTITNSLTLPNLRKLVLQDLFTTPIVSPPMDPHYGSLIVEEMISPLERLTHLSLAMSKVSLERLECLGSKTTLVWLNLSNIRISDFQRVLTNLAPLKNLQHLDLSQGDEEIIPLMYRDSQNFMREIMDTFPTLTSLDVSGTNLAGFEPPEYVSHRMETVKSRNKEEEEHCCIPGLEGRHLEFLGLLGCAYAACSRTNIPANRVTGDANPAQVLLAVQVYLDNQWLLIKALNDLFNFFRFSSVPNHCAALEAILAAMRNFPMDSSVQIAGSASLFYIAKGDQKKNITQRHKRSMISLLLKAMGNHSMEQTMMRNACLTLCHMNLPDDVMFCYERLVKELLSMLQYAYRDDFIHRLGIFLLNCLACQVEGKEKELVGKMGAVDTMLQIIQRKLRGDDCDDVLEVAWSTLWNVTDETPANCKKFLDKGGMECFVQCLQKFPDKPELLRNMMGLMGNIAEVDHLRWQLMDPKYVQIFSDLLESTSDGIEVSYNACGVLSHMCFDGPEKWNLDKPSRSEVTSRMEAAISRWPLNSKRNINYRSFQPILRLVGHFGTPQVQHWAVWALCNLTCVSPEKYCDLLKREGGQEILQGVLDDPRPKRCVRDLVERTLKQLNKKQAQRCDHDLDDNEREEYIVDVQEGEDTEEDEEEVEEIEEEDEEDDEEDRVNEGDRERNERYEEMDDNEALDEVDEEFHDAQAE